MYRYNVDRIRPELFSPRNLFFRCRSVLLRVSESLARMADRALQRRALAALDDRMLKDMGLTPDDVAREIARPFWR
jgi:uncharacterized protein YjiS (DUF1127 family)